MKILRFIFIAILFLGCTKDSVVSENILDKPYEEIKLDAKGTEVSIYMWGGSREVNDYFDFFVTPQVKKLFDIRLNRVPIDNVKTVLHKIELEKNSNKKGTVDIVWINGENFKIAKSKSLLYGPFVSKLPNYNNFVDIQKSTNL